MLTIPRRPDKIEDFLGVDQPPSASSILIELERIFSAVRRQFWIVFLVALLGAAAGVLSLAPRVPAYTASALVLIDNRRVRTVESAYDNTLNIDVAASLVDSQVEVVKATQVSEAVVRR